MTSDEAVLPFDRTADFFPAEEPFLHLSLLHKG